MATVLNMVGDRVNYLSIALRARGAINALKSLIGAKQGVLPLPNEELRQDLEGVIRSFQAAGAASKLNHKLASEETYSPYEEVQTVDEVMRSFKDKDALSRLQLLLNTGCNELEMRTAIRLFAAIERRALYHYGDPAGTTSGS
jgi:hypothetical protein